MQAPEPILNQDSPQALRPSARRSASQVLVAAVGQALKLGVALALALAAWEAILSAWVFQPAPYRQDADFGWMPRPGASAFTNIEGHAASFYNERGFRDEPITPRQPGELRVLCLGDSFVEALDVPREQSFEVRLQEMLSKYLQAQSQPGLPRRVRVFNAGRSGTSVGTALYFAPQYRKLFDPDLVIVMVHDEWSVALDPTQEVRYIPEGGTFRLQMFNHSAKSGAMFRRLVALGVRDLSIATHGSRQLRLMRTGGGAEGGESDAPQAKVPQADAPGAGEKSDKRLPRAEVTSEGGPGALRAASQAGHGGLSPELLERAAAWTPSQLKAAYPQLLVVHVPQTDSKQRGLAPISLTERAFLKSCREAGVATIDMRPVIESDFARTQAPPFGFPTTLPWMGHFNAHGHDLAAQAIFEAIRAKPALLRPRA